MLRTALIWGEEVERIFETAERLKISRLPIARIGILHSLSFYFTSVAFYAALLGWLAATSGLS